jgi:hypothetical protein
MTTQPDAERSRIVSFQYRYDKVLLRYRTREVRKDLSECRLVRVIYVAILLLTLVSCAQPVKWSPGPGVAVTDFEPVKARCSLMARHGGGDFVAYGSQSYVAGAELGHAIGEAVRMQADFSDCMKASGWLPVNSEMEASRNLKRIQIATLREQQLSCVNEVRGNARYDTLVTHLADVRSGNYSMLQLTDESIPTAAESHLVAAYWDEAKPCLTKGAEELSTIVPEAVPIRPQQISDNEQVIILLVKRQISWGEADRRQKANAEMALVKLRAIRI